MKRSLYIIGIALAAIGCAKDETTTTTPTDGEINFSAGVTTRVSSGDDCKWVANDDDNDADKIGIFTDQTGEDNMLFTISDAATGEMTIDEDETPLYTLTSGKRTYYAYHPYDETLGETTTTIAVDCTTDQSNYLLWATATSNDTEVALQFTHQLPKVTFNLTAGGVDVTTLKDATVWITGATSKATFDIKTGEFTAESTDNIDLTIDNNSVTAYLLPSTTAAKLWINTEGNTFVKSLDTWVSGSSYEYDITVGREPINVGDYLYTDNSFSSSKIDGRDSEILGIVYKVNDDLRSGMITSLDQMSNVVWASVSYDIYDCESFDDGLANMAAIAKDTNGKDAGAFGSNYAIFEWAHQKNISLDASFDYTIGYVSGNKDVWYIPAINELKELYSAWSSNATIQSIATFAGWGWCWSSTEEHSTNAYFVMFYTDSTDGHSSQTKNDTLGSPIAKAVLSFDLDD